MVMERCRFSINERFLGVLINMAITTKAELNDYLLTNWVDYQPLFKDILLKEKFLQSSSNWPNPKYFDMIWKSMQYSDVLGQKIQGILHP